MKTLSLLILFTLTAPVARADMLAAIAVVEDWRGRVGQAGEIGPYQMLPSTRADRRRDLAARGIHHPTERQLAEAQLVWISDRLQAAGAAPLPFNLALCWNAGVTATVRNRAPVRSYEYARRVVAIMEAGR